MPRQQITIGELTREGIAPVNQVTADDVQRLYFASNQGETIIEIVNKHGSNIGRVGVEFFEETLDDVVITEKLSDAIPAGGTLILGPFPSQWYSRDDLTVNINPVAGSAASLWFRGYEINVLG